MADDKELKEIVMKENQDVKLEKWHREVGILEEIKTNLEEYARLKDEKGEKDDIDRLNAKIANAIEDNSWARLEWGTIKRGKASRAEGLEKIAKKISDRNKKIKAREKQLEEEAGEEKAHIADIKKAVDECTEGSLFYHWAYGEMEVLAIDGEYIYLKVLDKKGCKSKWLKKNNAELTLDGMTEQVKEFHKNAIGRWLFTRSERVTVPESEEAHKLFR
jgi:hypothetical protein